MSPATQVQIIINGTVDLPAAENYASRIRAAVKNDIQSIEVILSGNTVITSAEFLAFLSQTALQMKKENRQLIFSGVQGKNQTLFIISRLTEFIKS